LNADPDPDPATQMNADPCGSGSGYGSGSETLLETHFTLNLLILPGGDHLEKILLFWILLGFNF
jgi:hypothetical protein